MFTIADIVARFANELEVVHVGEIDASMKHVAENMRKRLRSDRRFVEEEW